MGLINPEPERRDDALTSQSQDRHLHVEFDLKAADHQLEVDAPRLQQVFWNVFRNAYKFSALDGAISVRSHNLNPETIVIEIADNGLGIDAAFIEKNLRRVRAS
ncbi:MAG: ATP-binding protein [Spartobacteria bacterium]